MIYQDQIGRNFELTGTPQKIISCVPSITELLFYLIPSSHIIGRTKFCIHPKELVVNTPKIGGTKTLLLKKIRSLNPDLIIANKEENKKQQIEVLDFPICVTDVSDIDSAIDMIRLLGNILSVEEKAMHLVEKIETLNIQSFSSFISCAYLIWKQPYMSIGSDTYIHSMLKSSGFKNIFEDQLRYPEITVSELNKRQPECIMLSSEPFPFKNKHILELQKLLAYDPHIVLVDGEMLSWYGSKTSDGLKYAQQLRSSL